MEMMFSHHNSNHNELVFVFKNRKTRHGKDGHMNFNFGIGLMMPPCVTREKSIVPLRQGIEVHYIFTKTAPQIQIFRKANFRGCR